MSPPDSAEPPSSTTHRRSGTATPTRCGVPALFGPAENSRLPVGLPEPFTDSDTFEDRAGANDPRPAVDGNEGVR